MRQQDSLELQRSLQSSTKELENSQQELARLKDESDTQLQPTMGEHLMDLEQVFR